MSSYKKFQSPTAQLPIPPPGPGSQPWLRGHRVGRDAACELPELGAPAVLLGGRGTEWRFRWISPRWLLRGGGHWNLMGNVGGVFLSLGQTLTLYPHPGLFSHRPPGHAHSHAQGPLPPSTATGEQAQGPRLHWGRRGCVWGWGLCEVNGVTEPPLDAGTHGPRLSPPRSVLSGLPAGQLREWLFWSLSCCLAEGGATSL